jgi:hypothetical protein
VLKRRHGLNRCRYRGFAGMQRWVGLGVIADNLINIGRRLGPTASQQVVSGAAPGIVERGPKETAR